MATDDPLMTDFDLMRQSKKRKAPWWKCQNSPMICTEVVKVLLARMAKAACDDEELRAAGKLVITKLVLLPEFVEALHKTYLHRALLEQGVLDVIGQWIQPTQDGKLAYHEITKRLITSLLALTGIEVKHLKECKLPKILMVLRVHKDETLDNRHLANELVTRWMRMVFEIPTRVHREEPNHTDV